MAHDNSMLYIHYHLGNTSRLRLGWHDIKNISIQSLFFTLTFLKVLSPLLPKINIFIPMMPFKVMDDAS